MSTNSLSLHQTVHSWKPMMQDKGLKSRRYGIARQRKGLCTSRPSGTCLQRGLKQQCSIQELNKNIHISKQAEEKCKEGWSLREHDSKDVKKEEPVAFALYHASTTPGLHSKQTLVRTAGRLYADSFMSERLQLLLSEQQSRQESIGGNTSGLGIHREKHWLVRWNGALQLEYKHFSIHYVSFTFSALQTKAGTGK